jgi:hypothetical protein
MTNGQSPDLDPMAAPIRHRHCERSEAIQWLRPLHFEFWIASSLRSSQ